jgi:hypothetical protein
VVADTVTHIGIAVAMLDIAPVLLAARALRPARGGRGFRNG